MPAHRVIDQDLLAYAERMRRDGNLSLRVAARVAGVSLSALKKYTLRVRDAALQRLRAPPAIERTSRWTKPTTAAPIVACPLCGVPRMWLGQRRLEVFAWTADGRYFLAREHAC